MRASSTFADGGEALLIDNGNASALHDLRISNFHYGLEYDAVDGTLRHCQIAYCMTPISYVSGLSLIGLRCQNILITHFGTVAFDATYEALSGENVTVTYGPLLATTSSGGAVYLTNSIIASVSTNTSFSGSFNQVVSDASTVFQSVGSGYHYLPASSPYKGAGTTNIDPALVLDSAQRTTYPPLVLTSDITTDTVLTPQAGRNGGAIDLGYHYDPADYAVGGLTVSGAQLLLTNGVVIAVYGTNGLSLGSGATLTSEGTPTHLNRFTRYSSIQEQQTLWGSAAPVMSLLSVPSSLATLPSAALRFTHVPQIASATNGNIFLNASSSNKVASFTMMDCQLQNVAVTFAPVVDARSSSIALTNNLFERCVCRFIQGTSDGSPLGLNLANNLFTGGSVTLTDSTNVSPWSVYRNLFDGTIASFSSGITNGNNGYYSVSAIPSSTGGDITLSSLPDYQIGSLGRFYYSPTGGNISQLIDAGGVPAPNVGLYHYTTLPDETPEGTNTVDIGFHYVALKPGLMQGLVGFWQFNDNRFSSIALDSSGYQNNGTLVNGPLYYVGLPPHEGFMKFQATGDYVNIGNPTNGSLDFGTNSFSYGMWVNVSSIWGSWDFPWYKGGSYYSDPGYAFVFGSSAWYAQINDGPNLISPGVSATSLFDQWTHFFAVVDRAANQIRLYVNGTLQDSASLTGFGSVSSSTAATIGNATNRFQGYIDDVRVYNRALNGSEVASLASTTALGAAFGSLQDCADADGDGIPDYLEDRNGNGLVDSGETDWQDANDDGLDILITRPGPSSNVP